MDKYQPIDPYCSVVIKNGKIFFVIYFHSIKQIHFIFRLHLLSNHFNINLRCIKFLIKHYIVFLLLSCNPNN